MDYTAHNNEMLKKYGHMPLLSSKILGRKINSVSFMPLSTIEIQRSFEMGNAFQISDTANGLDVYYEPVGLWPGNKMVFVKDILSKGIVRGDVCEIEYISPSNKIEVSWLKNDGKKEYVRNISPTDIVYDADYRFAHFFKVNIGNNNNPSIGNNIGSKKEGHFNDDMNQIIYTLRYKGQLTKEVAAQMQEQFKKVKPGLAKLQEEGKYAFVLGDRYINPNSLVSASELDMYFMPKKYDDVVLTNDIKKVLSGFKAKKVKII